MNMFDVIVVSFTIGCVMGGSIMKVICMKAISKSNKEHASTYSKQQ
jgi:hypothetical protein